MDKMREQFEIAARAKGINLTLATTGEYAFVAADHAWWAWKVALASVSAGQEERTAAPPLPLSMDTAERISLSTVDCPELLEKLGAYAAAPNLDTAWAVLQCADQRLHHILKRRFEIARGEPIAHLRFRAAQQWSGIGGPDIEHAEWFEACHAHEIGDDKQPAFPVYAHPAPAAPQQCAEAVYFIRQKLGQNSWTECASKDSHDGCMALGVYESRVLYKEAARQVPTVAVIRQAILDYYDDLTARKHGGIAMDKAFNKIEDALGMCWQDEALIKRSAATTQEKP